jgi:hypothetical protein
MKLVKCMIVTLALTLVAASASYAAVSFTSASTYNMMAPNARNGLSGNITLNAIANGSAPTGETIIISYPGAQISVLSSVCVKLTAFSGTIGYGAGCSGVSIAVGAFTGYDVALPQAGVAQVAVGRTSISINFLGVVPFVAPGDGFEISGVRLNIVQATGGTATGMRLDANVYSIMSQISTTNPILPVAYTQDPINISASTKAQLSSGGIGLTGAPVVAGPPGSVHATVTTIEGPNLPNAFGAAVAATQLIYKIANIPTGVVTPVATVTASGTVTAAVAPGYPQQVGSNATVIVNITASDPASTETITLDITFAATAGASIPSGTIGTATVTLGPEVTGAAGAALLTLATPLTLGPLYYQAQYEATVNVIEILQLTTELLSVFNISDGSYNSGIAIYNGTGYLGPVAQVADIIVTLQPYNAPTTPIAPVTTSATFKPGVGLNDAGKLPAGGTWIVSLSDILKAMGQTGSFQGAIRFTCNFTNGHGIVWIGDIHYAVQSQGYAMLVLSNTQNGPRSSTFESLGN